MEIEAGESLASIAQRRFGDARFARLIFTINRGEIPIRCDGFNTFAFIAPGQRLQLPTIDEADIYKRNFFTTTSKLKFDLSHFARPAMPSDSIPSSFLNARPSGWGEATVDTSHLSTQPSQSTLFTRIEKSELERPHLVNTPPVKAPDVSEVFDMTPPAEEVQAEPVQTPPPPIIGVPFKSSATKTKSVELVDDRDLFFSQGNLEITTLSHYCRVMKFESAQASDVFVRLQVFDNNRWQTISSYTIKRESTMRASHFADGTVEWVQIDLPQKIAGELSLSDYQRNWKNYTKVYFNHKEKSRLEQISMAFTNVRAAI